MNREIDNFNSIFRDSLADEVNSAFGAGISDEMELVNLRHNSIRGSDGDIPEGYRNLLRELRGNDRKAIVTTINALAQAGITVGSLRRLPVSELLFVSKVSPKSIEFAQRMFRKNEDSTS